MSLAATDLLGIVKPNEAAKMRIWQFDLGRLFEDLERFLCLPSFSPGNGTFHLGSQKSWTALSLHEIMIPQIHGLTHSIDL